MKIRKSNVVAFLTGVATMTLAKIFHVPFLPAIILMAVAFTGGMITGDKT